MDYLNVRHDGLGKFRRITGSGKFTVATRADAQKDLWEKQWTRRKAVEGKYAGSPAVSDLKILQAQELTEDAERVLSSLTSILLDALRPRLAVDWPAFADRKDFSEPPPPAPTPLDIASEPRAADVKYTAPKQSYFSALLHPRRVKKERQALEATFANAHKEWQMTVQWKAQEHGQAQQRYQAALADWDARKSAFHAAQTKTNARLEDLRKRYGEAEPGAIADTCDLVLLSAPRPDGFARYWRIEFNAGSGAMSVDYELPSPDDMPSLKAVKYVPAKDGFESVSLSEREIAALYEESMYQTCLASLHLLFAADPGETIRSITFNGWANTIDKIAGKPVRACILSVQVTKAAYRKIELSSVDPKSCFRALKGIAADRLADMEPVAPVVQPA